MEFSPQQVTNEVRNPARDLRRLLVIDDDACIGAAIRAIMAYHHCDTVHETRAYAGISALKQFAFDVVMVDIFLPGLSGLEAIGYIRRDSSIPIIAMSGFRLRSSIDSLDYLGMATLQGATLCIRKPFRSTQLIEAIAFASSPVVSN
jgi:DNA-binding response OmpR family regulator